MPMPEVRKGLENQRAEENPVATGRRDSLSGYIMRLFADNVPPSLPNSTRKLEKSRYGRVSETWLEFVPRKADGCLLIPTESRD